MRPEATEALAALVAADLRIAALLCLLLLLLPLSRRLSGAARHALWASSVVACLLLPLLAPLVPDVAVPLPLLHSLAAPTVATAAGATSADVGAPATLSLAGLLMAGYLAGVAWCLSGLARRGLALRRLARAPCVAVPEPVAARWSALRAAQCPGKRVSLCLKPGIDTPLAWGWRHPVVALPPLAATWPTHALDAALRHELAHVRRNDWALSLLMQVLCALHWFNPLVWLAARRLSSEAERCCDDAVLRAGGRPSDYAGLLVSLAAGRERDHAALAGTGRGDNELTARIHDILDPDRNRRPDMKAPPALLAIAVFGTATVLAACQATPAVAGHLGDEPPPPAPVEAAAPSAVASPVPSPAPVTAPAPVQAVAAPPVSAAPAPAPVVAASPPAVPAPAAAPTAIPAAPVAPAGARPVEATEAEQRQLEREARRLEAEKREIAREVRQRREELRHMEKALDAERAEVSRQIESTRREMREARRAIDAEKRRLESEKRLLEEERRELERHKRARDDEKL